MKIYGDYSFVFDKLNVMYEFQIQIAQNDLTVNYREQIVLVAVYR